MTTGEDIVSHRTLDSGSTSDRLSGAEHSGSHLTTSLVAFNIGVELGQIVVLAVGIPLLALLFERVVPERMGTVLLSALVAHTAWHWMSERYSALREYRFAWLSWKDSAQGLPRSTTVNLEHRWRAPGAAG